MMYGTCSKLAVLSMKTTTLVLASMSEPRVGHEVKPMVEEGGDQAYADRPAVSKAEPKVVAGRLSMLTIKREMTGLSAGDRRIAHLR
jgi:hypothetical protein